MKNFFFARVRPVIVASLIAVAVAVQPNQK